MTENDPSMGGAVNRYQRSPERTAPPTYKDGNQCVAHKKSGERCQKAPINGAKVCRFHGGAAPHVKAAAKARLENAADRMAKALLKIAVDDAAPLPVRLAAIKDALDRAGLTPRQALDVTHELKPYERLLQHVERGPRPGREDRPSLALDDVIEAEVVQEEGEGAPACRGCGLDFSPWPEPEGGYPARCVECREASADSPRPSPSGAYARDAGVTENGLLSGEDAAAEAAQGVARQRRRRSSRA